jgi:integrase
MPRQLRGSIERLPSGKFRVKVYAGKDRITHTHRWHREIVDTREEAERLRDRMVILREEPAPDAPTVGELVISWFKEVAEERVKNGSLRAMTKAEYADIAARAFVLVPGFRDRRADDVHDLSRVYAKIAAKRPGGGARFIQQFHGILRQTYGWAVGDPWRLKYDPTTAAIEMPRPKRLPHRALPPEEVERFLRELPEEEAMGLVLELAVKSGLRPSEAVGIRIEQLDLEGGTFRVDHRVRKKREKGAGYDYDVPKSERSRRTLPMPPDMISRLAEQIRRAKEAQLGGKNPKALLFPARTGTPLDAHNMTNRVIPRVAKRAKIFGRVTFHGLRHTYATILVKNGIPIHELAASMGHQDPSLTMRVYAQPGDEANFALASIVSEAARKAAATPRRQASATVESGAALRRDVR